MVAENYGYTAIENQKNKNLSNDFSDAPYYIEDVADVQLDENQIDDLTPIQKFYDGTNVFITGSTGFLGKILVEKLLRSCPTISSIYLLVRDKKGKNLEQRVDEMFDDVIFDRLRKECPKFRHKVVGVAGDCSLPELGLSLQDKRLLIDEIHIIFHVAATVRFDEKLETAVAINIRSPRDLLRLGREMSKLKSFIHVSTVYANCTNNCIEEKIYPGAIDGEKMIMLTENVPGKILDDMTPRLLENYPNTYAYTKQIAEDIVRRESDNMPVGIFRPAIVIATYKEPVKSWINNMYGPTGVVAGVGVGLLRTLYCDPEVNANLVPVDMCVNSLITAAWEVGESYRKDQKSYDIMVYNYESGKDQPINWGKFMHLSHHYGIEYPSTKAIWYYSFKLYKYYPVYLFWTFLLHTLPALLADTVLFCLGKQPRLMAAYKKVHKFSSVISYFCTREWDVRSDSLRRQQERMCDKDRELFFSDLKQLDWDEYYKTYCKGVRQYLLQDPLETLEVAQTKWRRLYFAHQAVKFFSGFGLMAMAYWLFETCIYLIV
ncbi:unnamed protein product [Ceutorhynchus assimilis]|uniref:Fatty acyl-CoA reductase n=1 Tax=Ceutorhynchus assimilis TaxID=467358 RepID=A0A9N9QH73_9CUCU|nr:unnamed protein product [Ceutorhynchus assimilis]